MTTQVNNNTTVVTAAEIAGLLNASEAGATQPNFRGRMENGVTIVIDFSKKSFTLAVDGVKKAFTWVKGALADLWVAIKEWFQRHFAKQA